MDGNGTLILQDLSTSAQIDQRDLTIAMESLGYSMSQENIWKLITDLDPSNTGELDFDKFLELINKRMSQVSPIERAKMAFKVMDHDRSNDIVFSDLKQVALNLDIEMTDQEIHEMINEADTDNDGAISMAEFIRIANRAQEEIERENTEADQEIETGAMIKTDPPESQAED